MVRYRSVLSLYPVPLLMPAIETESTQTSIRAASQSIILTHPPRTQMIDASDNRFAVVNKPAQALAGTDDRMKRVDGARSQSVDGWSHALVDE